MLFNRQMAYGWRTDGIKHLISFLEWYEMFFVKKEHRERKNYR